MMGIIIFGVVILGFFFINTGEFDDSNAKEIIYSGMLEDVSEGSAFGSASATYGIEEGYKIIANFEALPNPEGTDFYEGWIVRKGLNFDVLSTGKAEKDLNGNYENTFNSNENLLDHDFYVLTIEPEDGNPDPAGHILEGTLIPNQTYLSK